MHETVMFIELRKQYIDTCGTMIVLQASVLCNEFSVLMMIRGDIETTPNHKYNQKGRKNHRSQLKIFFVMTLQTYLS